MNDKKISFEPIFEKQKDKLIFSGVVAQEKIDDTIALYLKNKFAKKLHYHKITCKKDKARRSITVLSTGQEYKILLSEQKHEVIFVFIGHHSKYDRANKHC